MRSLGMEQQAHQHRLAAIASCPRSLAGHWLLLPFAVGAGVALQGCACPPPEAQIDWEPPEEFRKRAGWFDEYGLWVGNPAWKFALEHEAEAYECKTMHDTLSICMVWTVKEHNCDEEDFGICKCHTLAEEGEYCQAWGCHALEADQKVCRWESDGEGGSKVKCSYDPFPMNEDTYQRIVARQEEGHLTSGEVQWWGLGSIWSARTNWRLLSEEDATAVGAESPAAVSSAAFLATLAANGTPQAIVGQPAPARMLQNQAWPPTAAYSPALRWQHFSLGEVCIANGDNVAIVKRKCEQWREIETEIAQCVCKQGSRHACEKWSCEERDIGLFSALFRTRQPIAEYVVGTEIEEYECKQFDEGGECIAWEGDIDSVEEVETTRCECIGGNCNGAGAKWACDEYELPKTKSIFFEGYRPLCVIFIMFEGCALCILCMEVGEDDGFIFGVGVAGSSCFSCCVLPFLIVTFGWPGFVLIGLAPWVIRCCCLCRLFRPGKGKKRSGSGPAQCVLGRAI